MGRPRPDGGTGGGNTDWGGETAKQVQGKGFAKGGANDYDAQRGCNERTKHYGPLWIQRGVRQAKGPFKGQDAVNP